MRVALIHDSFLYMGGAERVVMTLLSMFPGADIYTAFISNENRHLLYEVRARNIICSPYNIPHISESFASLTKPLIYIWWKSIDLSGYDIVISSSHSFSAKSVIVGNGIPHISYVHSPPRYLYDLPNQSKWIHTPILSSIVKPLLQTLRKHDIHAAQLPSVLIAGSRVVQERIRLCYHRKSYVIYPPVQIPRKVVKISPRYYLCFSHLLKQKGIDIAIHACNKLALPLFVVGSGPEEQYLRKIAGPTITFLGWISDSQIDDVYAGAIALLYPSIDEDFGIVPVEAMAHGVPVVAYKSGGVLETIIDGKTGLFFHSYTTESLIIAINKFTQQSWSSEVCKRRSTKYSSSRFIIQMSRIIQKYARNQTRKN